MRQIVFSFPNSNPRLQIGKQKWFRDTHRSRRVPSPAEAREKKRKTRVAGFTQREIKSNALPRNLNKTRALTNEIFRSPHHPPARSRRENTDSCYHIHHPTRQ